MGGFLASKEGLCCMELVTTKMIP